MKKILFLIITVLSAITLFGCSENEYPPVESTAEEARVVMTLNVEGTEYEVKYELYRAFFLNNKSTVDGGDSSVWTSENKQEYIDKINKIIIERITEIFAVIHRAKEIGFDPYSDKVDYEIEEYVRGAVEGDDEQIGHGSYDAYLESLKKNNLNYSTATFLLRYALAKDAIESYYYDDYSYSEDDVKEYYNSSDCQRVLQSYFQTGVLTYAQMSEYRSSLLKIDDELSLAAYIIGSTSVTESDLISDGKLTGIVIGKNELIGSEYSEYVNEIFSLSSGQFSNIITLKDTAADGYYVVYSLGKTDEHFEAAYSAIETSYLDNIIGRVLQSIGKELSGSLEFTSEYSSIDHSKISMD